MNLVRRRMDFEHFIDHYVLSGLAIGIVIVILLSLLLLATWVENRNTKIVESNLYLALKKEKVEDEAAIKIADFISKLYHGQSLDFEELKKSKETLTEKNQYFNVAIEHLDNVELILGGTPGDVKIEMKDPFWSWKYFLIGLGLISWLIIAISMSISYFVESFSCRDGVLTYPWGEIWSYPLILVMFPYLVISQPILLICYGIEKLKGENEEQIREEMANVRIRTGELPTISRFVLQEHIDKQRRELKSKIRLVKAAVGVHRQNWIKFYKQHLVERKEQIESEIEHYRHELSDLGQDIEDVQRSLAESQPILRDLEKSIQDNNTKGEREFALEFNKFRKIPHIEAVEIANEEIRIYTDTIYISYEDKKYEIGDFLIRFGTEKNGFIKVKNLCNTSTLDKDHPYSYNTRDQSFCFGDLSGYVATLLKQKDYFSLIIVILQALQSNEGDNPEIVKRWKEVKK